MVGGPKGNIPVDQVLKRKGQIWLAVDYGATFLLNQGIIPQVALGDFDSTDQNEYRYLQKRIKVVKKFPPQFKKNYTDTQLGVKEAFKYYDVEQLNIFGATGGRLDQLLANLYLPLQPTFKPFLEKIRFIDYENEMSFYFPGEHMIQKNPRMRYLAFVNLVPVVNLNLPDEKYPLTNFSSNIPFCWSSNEFNGDKNHFSFEKGIVAVIQSTDHQHGN